MDQRIVDQRITWIHYFKTVRHISSIFAYHNENIFVYVFVCFAFVIYYDLQVHFTSRARSIFTPTLQPWIANAVVTDVFITTPTTQNSVLKA